MESKIFSVHSHKGGVGKTTFALSIASVLATKAARRSHRVCIIDFDFVGPSMQFIFEPQLVKLNKRLILPFWFNSTVGSPNLDPSQIINYLWKVPQTEFQRKHFKTDIHLILCPASSFCIEMMDQAFKNPGTARKRIQDLIDALIRKGYKYIVIDSAPGFRDYSKVLYSISAGSGLQSCPIIVSSPAYADIFGITYQLDSLATLRSTKEPLWYLVNFLHGGYREKQKDYESFDSLCDLIEKQFGPQSSVKLSATIRHRIEYRCFRNYSLLARMCFLTNEQNDWFKAIYKSNINKGVEKIVDSVF